MSTRESAPTPKPQHDAAEFAAAVGQSAGVTTEPGAERRRLLLEYRQRVEKAKLEQEARLATLAQAQKRIEAELAGLDRSERAALEKQQQEQAAALEKEARERAATIAQRRKQVEDIQKHFVESEAKEATPRATKAAPPEARRSPRLDIHAVVRFGQKPDDVLMRARNISMTGALLSIEPDLVSKFAMGSEHDSFVFLSADPKGGIGLRSRVVRQEKNAIAVDWSDDVEATFRVALLISTLPPEEA